MLHYSYAGNDPADLAFPVIGAQDLCFQDFAYKLFEIYILAEFSP